MKLQRTGLTEGSLLYNNWLKKKNLYRADTEDEFINWLYSTSGWYDTAISGSYFDIDTDSVKRSDVYTRFLSEYHESLKNSDWFHVMLHSSWHLNGLESENQTEFVRQYSNTNRSFWLEPDFLRQTAQNKRVLVVSSIAPLIKEKYGDIVPYLTPQTHLNKGDAKNSWETLDRVTAEINILRPQFDFAFVSFGAYGCLLTDRIVRMGKDAATIGSGIYQLYPIGKIPNSFKPKGWEKIENGRYWR